MDWLVYWHLGWLKDPTAYMHLWSSHSLGGGIAQISALGNNGLRVNFDHTRRVASVLISKLFIALLSVSLSLEITYELLAFILNLDG